MRASLGPRIDEMALYAAHDARARRAKATAESKERAELWASAAAMAESLDGAHAVALVRQDQDGHLHRSFVLTVTAAERAARRARGRGETAAVVLMTVTPTVSYVPEDGEAR